MSDQEKKVTMENGTEEKIKELFQLMDEKEAAGELVEEEGAPQAQAHAAAAPDTQDPMTGSETAAYEYSMMIKQYEALLADYERMEAEEKAADAAKKQKETAGQES